MNPSEAVPVVLFAYARPGHLARVLASLRENRVPLVLAYADGAKGDADAARVAEVRALLRMVDWCELRLVEREKNLGLGRNVLAGVTETAARHEAFIVWEDDLVCVPGTYAWMCAALRHYRDDPRVMSVSGWTHPRVTPADVGEAPYFDGRADCWVWGAWARSWKGMTDGTALEKMRAAAARGVAPDAYGRDLPEQAAYEERKNVWAVRWLYHHFQHGGLCLRPPWSMVEHIGFDAAATNAAGATEWANPPLGPAPAVPAAWPEVREHPRCRAKWKELDSFTVHIARNLGRRLRRAVQGLWRGVLPGAFRAGVNRLRGRHLVRGDFACWADARKAARGYDDGAILGRVRAATCLTMEGRVSFERDGITFGAPEPDEALLRRLQAIAGERAGGGLRVLEFGGSLGSLYWRHRFFFPRSLALAWDVVEQPAFVEVGRREVEGRAEGLRFYPDVAAARREGDHDVLLCSNVLQYLEDPWAALAVWRAAGVRHVLLNNLPLIAGNRDRLRVQDVPPVLYRASYPLWFFSREAFLRRIAHDYEIVEEYASEAVWPVDGEQFRSTGLWLRPRIPA